MVFDLEELCTALPFSYIIIDFSAPFEASSTSFKLWKTQSLSRIYYILFKPQNLTQMSGEKLNVAVAGLGRMGMSRPAFPRARELKGAHTAPAKRKPMGSDRADVSCCR